MTDDGLDISAVLRFSGGGIYSSSFLLAGFTGDITNLKSILVLDTLKKWLLSVSETYLFFA